MSIDPHNPINQIKVLLKAFNIDKNDLQELGLLATQNNNFHLNLKLVNIINAYDQNLMEKTEELTSDLKNLLKFMD